MGTLHFHSQDLSISIEYGHPSAVRGDGEWITPPSDAYGWDVARAIRLSPPLSEVVRGAIGAEDVAGRIFGRGPSHTVWVPTSLTATSEGRTWRAWVAREDSSFRCPGGGYITRLRHREGAWLDEVGAAEWAARVCAEDDLRHAAVVACHEARHVAERARVKEALRRVDAQIAERRAAQVKEAG